MGEYLRRPLVALEAVRALTGTWHRRGLRPSRAYLEWRAYTAYGEHKAAFQRRDLFHYLEWRRRMRQIAKRQVAP